METHSHTFNIRIALALLICLLIGPFSPASTASPIVAKVGGYLFEPFVKTQGENPSGLTIDLIKLLNKHQKKYYFHFVPTSPKRRYLDFERKVFDVMFFESKLWGWQEKNIQASKVFLTGGEVYIANRNLKTGMNQSFFEDLESKSLVGILGFHYGFANFDANEANLKKRFNISLVSSPQTIVNQVLAGKAEIGIVTVSYLKEQMNTSKNLKQQLLISEKKDQEYNHTILVREKHLEPSLSEMNIMLDQITKNGSLNKLLNQYGIEPYTH
jgi:ABC-type amino acid transport substrate-binding protein